MFVKFISFSTTPTPPTPILLNYNICFLLLQDSFWERTIKGDVNDIFGKTNIDRVGECWRMSELICKRLKGNARQRTIVLTNKQTQNPFSYNNSILTFYCYPYTTPQSKTNLIRKVTTVKNFVIQWKSTRKTQGKIV